MSEDLDNKGVKAKTTRKRATKTTTFKKKVEPKVEPKDELLTAEYKYDAKKDEELIMDKPSTPLVKETKNNNQMNPNPPIQTNGQIYDAYVKELKDFKLVYNGDVIYDSTLSKVNTNLKFVRNC